MHNDLLPTVVLTYTTNTISIPSTINTINGSCTQLLQYEYQSMSPQAMPSSQQFKQYTCPPYPTYLNPYLVEMPTSMPYATYP